MVKITIDGIEIEVEPGTTILDAARQINPGTAPPRHVFPFKARG